MYGHAVSVIRLWRDSEGLSQAQLAARLGTSQSAVARLEAPGANPRLKTLERVASALGRDLEIRASRVAEPALDAAHLDKHLAMSPAERLRMHHAASRNLRRLTAKARRADMA